MNLEFKKLEDEFWVNISEFNRYFDADEREDIDFRDDISERVQEIFRILFYQDEIEKTVLLAAMLKLTYVKTHEERLGKYLNENPDSGEIDYLKKEFLIEKEILLGFAHQFNTITWATLAGDEIKNATYGKQQFILKKLEKYQIILTQNVTLERETLGGTLHVCYNPVWKKLAPAKNTKKLGDLDLNQQILLLDKLGVINFLEEALVTDVKTDVAKIISRLLNKNNKNTLDAIYRLDKLPRILGKKYQKDFKIVDEIINSL